MAGEIIKQAVVALIETKRKSEDARRLLCVWNKRYGGWTLPGGLQEKGEGADQALQRELKEETGLEAAALMSCYYGPHGGEQKPGRATHVQVFRVSPRGGPARETEEGCPVTWLTRGEFLAWCPFADFYRKVFADLDVMDKQEPMQALKWLDHPAYSAVGGGWREDEVRSVLGAAPNETTVVAAKRHEHYRAQLNEVHEALSWVDALDTMGTVEAAKQANKQLKAAKELLHGQAQREAQAMDLILDFIEHPGSYRIDNPRLENRATKVRERLHKLEGPVAIRIHCPECGELHVDEGEWATRPHHTHSCQNCGNTWRPSKRNTVGVRFIPEFKNEPRDEEEYVVGVDVGMADDCMAIVMKKRADGKLEVVSVTPKPVVRDKS